MSTKRPSRPSRYKKTSVEVYEVRALGLARSLRSSLISTHVGLDADPAVQVPTANSVQGRGRHSRLDHQAADDLTVL